MAEQPSAGLEELKLRQETLLTKLGSLQSRVNSIQREQNIPYDTKNITSTQFKQLQSKQSQIFDRLLDIAGKIEGIASKQKIELPAGNEVSAVIDSMAKNLEKRQKRTLSQLKLLSTVATSIQTFAMTQEIKNLIIDKPAPQKEVQEEEKKESIQLNTYKSRTYDLELVSEALRAECKRMDNYDTGNGQIRKQQLNSLLEKVTLIDVEKSVLNEAHIQLIIDSLCNTADSMIDYNNFLDLIMDCDATDKLINVAKEWNLFRYNLIGSGRIEGLLRILYRYDGWPEPISFVVKEIETETKNGISLQQILDHVTANCKDSVEYEELRYATNPTFVPGKRGWQALKTYDMTNEKVPFLICNDGTLEIDIWLRTNDFIANKPGRPLPEENDEDLVDID